MLALIDQLIKEHSEIFTTLSTRTKKEESVIFPEYEKVNQ